MELKSLTFEFEVVTPMFLAGEKQKKGQGRIEFRVPSLRGVLRWWFRALAGGLVDGDVKKIVKLETDVFGGSGENAGQSRVLLRAGTLIDRSEIDSFHPLPRRENVPFDGITPGTKLQVTVSSNPYYGDDAYFDTRLSFLEVAWLLGGLGRRSRRGFGSFQPVARKFLTRDDLASTITEAIDGARQSLGEHTEHNVSETASRPEFPTVSQKACFIGIGKEYGGWEDLIKDVMNAIHEGIESGSISQKIIGSLNPRQGSSLVVAAKSLSNRRIVPVFSLFLTKTATGQITEKEWERAARFIEKNFDVVQVAIR